MKHKFDFYMEAVGQHYNIQNMIEKATEGQIKFARKPSTIEDIPIFDLNDLYPITRNAEQFVKILSQLNVYHKEDLYGYDGASFLAHFMQPTESVFIMDSPDGYILVDTSGYDYARYALRLEGLDDFI